MKYYLSQKLTLVATAIIALAMMGCSVVPEARPDLTRYYVLTNTQGNSQGVAKVSDGLKLGLNRVEVSRYLDKGSLVVLRGTNELVYNDYARWAEPISEGVGRIVRARLLDDPKVSRVFMDAFPFDQSRDYDISINVTHCEGATIGRASKVRFAAVVEITSTGDNAKVISRTEFTAPLQNWDGRNYSALTQLLSESVALLCDDLVASLNEK
tara:strand:+ start:399 stop:1031 length:633 start_codon:yes stop_codon:yes gene_type:complete